MTRLLPVIAALMLCGCAVNALDKGEREKVSYYTLDAAPIAAEGSDSRTLALEAVTAAAPVENMQLVRRLEKDGPLFLLYAEHHRWSAAPRSMCAALAHEYFAAHFDHVGHYPGTSGADLVLRMHVLRFEEVRARDAGTGSAHVRLQVQWLDREGRRLGPNSIVDGEASTAHGDESDYVVVARALRTALLAALEKVRTSAPTR